MNTTTQQTGGPPEPRKASLIWGLRFRTLLLVLLAVVPALLLMAYTARHQRELLASREEENTQRVVRLVAADVNGKVEGAREMLITLAELPAVRTRDSRVCTPIFERLLKNNTLYANLGAAAPNGDVFCSARPMETPVNVAHRQYFKRAVQSREFSVGDYQVGLITKEETINFSYPVYDERGRLLAVVYAALKLDWMAERAAWNLSADTTLTIIDETGKILIRYPNPGEFIGKDIGHIPLVRSLLANPDGKLTGYGLDNVRRVIAYTPLSQSEVGRDVYIILGVPFDPTDREIQNLYLRAILGMGAVAVLALIAAWVGGDLFFLRQVKALVRAARRIRAGDLTARTGVQYGRDELSGLTYAFDSMADSLEHLTGRQELILSSAGEGIYGVDRQGSTTFVNPAAARMLGYAPEELIGRPHHEVFHHTRSDGAPYPDEECPIGQTYADGTVHRGDDEVFWRKDGSSFPVDYVATPAREHGEIIGAVVVFKDITQRKEAEQEVARAHEELLRTALEKKRFYREVIRSVTKQKLNLVDPDDIPAEGCLIAEGTLESPEDDRAARRRVRSLAEEAGMDSDRARELVLAVGEATTNAVKHAVRGRYALCRADDRIIVRISDNGAGIDTEDLPATLLQPGFSTKVSMGMGYTLMLELADRVWLTTGPEGTTIQLEKWIKPAERPQTPLAAAVERI